MKTAITDQLDSAEARLNEKEFDEAIRILKRIDRSSLKRDDKRRYDLILIEYKLWTSDYDIEDTLKKTLEYFKKSSNNALYARAKYLYGWLLVQTGCNLEAREVLLESYLYFKRYDDLPNMARALNRLSYVLFKTGDIEGTVTYLNKCLGVFKKLNRKESVITISRNIATIHLSSGSLVKAVEQYRLLESILKIQNEQNRFQYYVMYSLAVALKGDLKTAHELISKTEKFSDEFKHEKALYYENLGWIYNLEEKFDRAVEILRKGIEFSLKIAPESDLISQTKRLLADAYIGLGKYDSAQKTAEEALTVAEKIGERSEIAACYRVFAQVAGQNNDPAHAKDYFNKAVDIFSAIDSRYERAVTYYLMAVSGLYDNDERNYLLHKAREYFEAEEVKPFIARVDRALENFQQPVIRESDRAESIFIAKHDRSRKVVELAEIVARSNFTVLLTGETGTGKDCLAQYIHACSGRTGKLIKVNTAALPESMVESELFGFEKGAFTGAVRERRGKFELAENGTIYLNEIGDMPLQAQTRLLHVLEDKTLERLGAENSLAITARIIAATNRDLRKLIEEGKFRCDLYYRLNQFYIELPPLSERLGDIPELARYFLEKNGFDLKNNGNADALRAFFDALENRDWPGNIRELESIIDRLYLTGDGDIEKMTGLLKQRTLSEKETLVNTLEETGWNRSEAARRLNIAESTVRKRIKKYGLNE